MIIKNLIILTSNQIIKKNIKILINIPITMKILKILNPKYKNIKSVILN